MSWMSEEMGLLPLWSPTTEAPINLQTHAHLHMGERQRADRLTCRPRINRWASVCIQEDHLLAFAAVQQHILLCTSHSEENIITTVKYAQNTYCGKRVNYRIYSISVIHMSLLKTFLQEVAKLVAKHIFLLLEMKTGAAPAAPC